VGDVVEQAVTVINTSDQQQTFFSSVANFTPGPDGTAIFDGGADDDFSSWVSVAPSVEIGPGGLASVSVQVAVPKGARPGVYYGVIFFGTSTSGVSASAAHLVFLTVEGPEVLERGEIVSLNLSPRHASSLSRVQATVTFQNSGTVYLRPDGDIQSDAVIGGTDLAAFNPENRRVLPRETRSWEVPILEKRFEGLLAEWRPFAIGPVRILVTARLGTTFLDGRQELVYVWPWRTLLLVLVLAMAVWSISSLLKRRYRTSRLWNSSNGLSE
jgi:hypothetical protein